MRITQSMYYQNFQSNNSALSNALLNTTEQISSGIKIQYAYQSPNTFAKALSLNNEISTFNQVTDSINSGQNFTTQTDATLSNMVNSLRQFKTDLIQASSGTQSKTSMNAIAMALTGIKKNLVNLANTSINGQYLFSGSATDQKPINANGIYNGNAQTMTSFLGAGVTQAHNIPGSDLFLGTDSSVNKIITTNIPHFNQTLLHPSVMTTNTTQDSQQSYITANNTIRDLMGSSSSTINNTSTKHHFYIQGTQHDGTTFKTTISLTDINTVQDLMTKIGELYGNTPSNTVVDVSLNSHGEFVIKDKLSGSSKLSFHMVANTASTAEANLNNLNTDNTPLVNFNQSLTASYVPSISQQRSLYTPSDFSLNMQMVTKNGKMASASTSLSAIFASNLSTISFSGKNTNGAAVTSSFTPTATSTVQDLMNAIKSSYQVTPADFNISLVNGKILFNTTSGQNNIQVTLTSKDSGSNTISGLTQNAGVNYNTAVFTQLGASLTSDVSQIVNADNSYATNGTKLSEVSGISPFVSSTKSQQLIFRGIDINGKVFKAQIDLKASGSTFSLDNGTTNYPIYNMNTPRVATDGNNVTYKQLGDVMNMILTDNLPASTTSAINYDTAISNADILGTVSLNKKGQLNFMQNNANITRAQISLYDVNSTDMTKPAASLAFNANNALTISDPKTDFFATINKAIDAVQHNMIYPDGLANNKTNVGVQNAIAMLDNLTTHVINIHSLVGSQTNSLQSALSVTSMLKVSTQTIQASVIDTNMAEATAKLSQLQLNQQALYASLARVSKLSLVNYI